MLIHYINSANLSEKQLMRQCLVHVCFLISAIAMAWTDKIVYSTIHKPHWGFYYKKHPTNRLVGCLIMSISNRFGFFGQETTQFLHGFCFNLADALGRDAVFCSKLVQRQPAVVLKPAAFHNTAAPVIQLRQSVL